jgi:hypothetical protein
MGRMPECCKRMDAQERPAVPQKTATRSRRHGKNSCYILFIKFNIDK